MHSFYTSVARYGNNILYRGYNQAGNRVQKKVWFKPKLYVKSDHQSEWKTMFGESVREINFESMKESKEFMAKYDEIENHSVYGMQNHIFGYITERFPDKIKYNPDIININTLDIEVESEDGFPKPELAEQEVLSITCHSTMDNVWRIWGLKDYDPNESYMKKTNPDANIQYIKCETEEELLHKFLIQWSKPEYTPDVVTGWYIRFFDIPYLVNRISKVLGENVKKLSPWGILSQRTVSFKGGKSSQAWDISGIQVIDYQDIFMKFGLLIYGPQETYKLDHIAYVVLNEHKLSYDEHSSLNGLYKANPQKFLDYNLKDVDLVVRIEQKIQLIRLVFSMAYRAGVNYSDTLGTTAIWDSIIYRFLNKEKIVIPQGKQHPNISYPGAFVKDVVPGLYEWVVSFDLNSLYPNTIAQYNMSPETLVNEPGHKDSIEYYLDKKTPVKSKHCIAANGAAYHKNFQGILPKIIIEYYAERSKIKKSMLAHEQEYENTGNKSLEVEIAREKSNEQAIKILMNSLYGALGNRHFRYYDLKTATAITKSGQLAILYVIKKFNTEMNKIMETNDIDYIIASDTDSMYINFGPLVDKFKPKNPVKFLDNVCEEKFQPLFDAAYDEIFKKQNCYVNRMSMAREVIADKAIWTAKKRYILRVLNSEGVQFAQPKMKVKGLEAVKSSTPEVCRDKMKELFKVMLDGGEPATQAFIKEFKEEFEKLPFEKIAKPAGVSEVDKYVGNKIAYIKGTPINSRASIVYNNYLKKLGLTNRYEQINDGSKIKMIHLKLPNPVKENIIAFVDYLPNEMKLNDYVDYDTQFEKTFLQPITLILDSIGWKSEEQSTLEDFFG